MYCSQRASASAAAVAPGGEIAVAAAIVAEGKPGAHMLHFRVYGPDGVERRHYAETITGEKGRATLTFRTALNDAPGPWRVVAADLASGLSGETEFVLK